MYGFGLNQPQGPYTPRTTALLKKVFDHLDSIDVRKLSTSELKDFLEVVQKGQFLEAYGQMPALGFGGFTGCGPIAPTINASAGAEDKPGDDVEQQRDLAVDSFAADV